MEIIANPLSGKNKGKEVLEQVQVFLNKKKIPFSVHITKEAGHGTQLAQKLCAEGAKTIIALGGDGTFHEVLNGMDFTKSRMGLIPAGRGNDYADGTGISRDPCQALEAIINGNLADYDYIQVGQKRCLNVGGTGLDVAVLQHTAKSNNSVTYTTSLIHCLLNYKPYKIQVELNGKTLDYSCVMAAVCNGSQFGGNIKLCPPAKNNDGLMNLIIIEKPPKIPTIFVMPCFVKGKHMNKPYVKHCLCESVKIITPAPIQLDGEIYYDIPFEAKIVKGGFKTFAI